MSEIFLYLTVFIGTYVGVKAFRTWSLKNKLFDLPNSRSLHTIPTPRGGGLIVVFVSLTAYIIYSFVYNRNLAISFLIASLLTALISWFDDLKTISFIWRFVVQSLSAIIVISTIGYFQKIYLPLLGNLNLGIYGAVFTFLWIVWMTNAFNFMDGSDGLAGTQAVTAGIGWLLIGRMAGFETIGLLGGIIGFSSLGFLIHNWSPADVFMGDVGSAFLGFSFAVLPLIGLGELSGSDISKENLWIYGIALNWMFFFDSFLTVCKRLIRGEKIWQAHRDHIYQNLIIFGFKHHFVAVLYGLFSILTIAYLIFGLLFSTENLHGLLLLLGGESLFLLILFYIAKNKNNAEIQA